MSDSILFEGDLAKIETILAADGFRLGRGTYPELKRRSWPTGRSWPTVEIDRPDTPGWQGVWSVVSGIEDEAETAALLMVRAWREWPEWRGDQ